MSRTYHHGDNAKCCLFDGVKWGERRPWQMADKPKRKRHKEEWHWMNTPHWFIREFMTVKQRAQVRSLERKVLQLIDVEDAPLFPLAKKPHIYYW